MDSESLNLSMDAGVEAPEPEVKIPEPAKKEPRRAPKKSKPDPEPPPIDLARQISRVNPMGDSSGNMIRYDLVLKRPSTLNGGRKQARTFWSRIDFWPKEKAKKKK